jgi:hypothetical protein
MVMTDVISFAALQDEHPEVFRERVSALEPNEFNHPLDTQGEAAR